MCTQLGLSSDRTPTDIVRGIQWRQAISWAGFEVLFKSVRGDNKIKTDELKRLTEVCEHLPNYVEMNPPKRTAKLEQWLNVDWCANNVAALDYTGLNGPDILKTMREWLVCGEPIKSWDQCLNLCRGFRHSTAHGALSATKIKQWNLTSHLDLLTVEIAILTTAILRQLVK